MTNYLLNESDYLAADANPALQSYAEASPEVAEGIAAGATTVIQFLRASAIDLRTTIGNLSEEAGAGRAKGESDFDAIYDQLHLNLQPRLDALRDSTIVAIAGGPTVTEEPTVEEEPTPVSERTAIDDVLEGIFASMLGPEAAAAIRKDVEAKYDAIEDEDFDDEDEDEYDDYDYSEDFDLYDDEDDEDEDETDEVTEAGNADSFTKFMESLFGNSFASHRVN